MAKDERKKEQLARIDAVVPMADEAGNYMEVRRGDKGSEVSGLKDLLVQNGYTSLNPSTATMGARATKTLKRFQADRGLDVTGIADNATWEALLDKVRGGQPAAQPLSQLEAARPAPYEGDYQGQIDSLLNSILNREKFSYDMNADPLYQQYKDQYVAGGRRAMMDTMGQAAALTGGYGNSYASTAGNQAYQQYLTGLGDKALGLYDRAYGAYQGEGDSLRQGLSALMGADNTAYGRRRDSYGDWLADRDYEYGKTRDQQNQDNWQAEYDYATRKWKRRRKA